MSTSMSASNTVEDDEQVQLRLGVTDPYIELEELCGLEELGPDEEEHILHEEQHDLDEEQPTKPHIGMQFSSAEEAYHFYNAYALRVGFSVRKSSKTTSRAGVSSQRFLCSKEGFCKNQKNFQMPIRSVSLDKSPQKVKSITRVGCKASMRVRRMKNGIWQVSVFVEEHNHVLITSPSKMRGLRSQKRISEEEEKMICDLNAQNVELSKIIEYIASQSSGRENLRTWLAAMHGKHPNSIITDQDPAMRKAIQEVFPGTLHRCCQWHVMRKAREHLGVLYGEKDGFKDELAAVINRSLTIDDFQDQWAAMIDRYKLGNVKHLKTMFTTRHEWVPAYFRGIFFADMSTTQRSESINAIFKTWVKCNTSIFQFVKRIENMIESIYQRESDEDLRSINEIPHIKTRYVIEVEGRRVYTRSVFAVFRELVLESTIGSVREIERDVKYEVIIKFHPFIKNWVPETYAVEVDIPTERFICNCKGFECEGLLCSHAIKVMQHVGFLHLPDHYVLKRWTKDANVVSKNTSCHTRLEIDESQQLEEHRIATLKGEFNKLAVIGSKSAELFSRMKCRIDDLKGEFVDVETIESDKESASVSDEVPCTELKVYDPYVSQCKGKRKNPTRFKPAADAGVKKRRRCKVCNKIAGHNARTCPLVGPERRVFFFVGKKEFLRFYCAKPGKRGESSAPCRRGLLLGHIQQNHDARPVVFQKLNPKPAKPEPLMKIGGW
ncbi:hypothetical protein LUZ61_008117 [Rhynchospora tenuis]|uniref:Protein FAR1-RELATED SEQUENCE n=1 Tax=Rhynchospora tenuis TaxID=198213 RepID=A0AAD6EX68_9POAL|nr:hypothetical protein LUZ61_008117 [Rhynchospora tenuis]